MVESKARIEIHQASSDTYEAPIPATVSNSPATAATRMRGEVKRPSGKRNRSKISATAPMTPNAVVTPASIDPHGRPKPDASAEPGRPRAKGRPIKAIAARSDAVWDGRERMNPAVNSDSPANARRMPATTAVSVSYDTRPPADRTSSLNCQSAWVPAKAEEARASASKTAIPSRPIRTFRMATSTGTDVAVIVEFLLFDAAHGDQAIS